MTQDVLWMTEDYFKDNSILNENVDWRVIQPIMILVQDQYIHPILGTNLFDEIANEIYATTTTAAICKKNNYLVCTKRISSSP